MISRTASGIEDDLRDRIADLEDEVDHLQRSLDSAEEERDELQRDLDNLSENGADDVVALREWLDRRTGELKWHEATAGQDSDHLRDLLAIQRVLNGAAAESLPL